MMTATRVVAVAAASFPSPGAGSNMSEDCEFSTTPERYFPSVCPGRLGEAAAAAGLHLLLDLVRDLLLGFEELGGAPVEADGLALIELALAVVLGNALLRADGGHPAVGGKREHSS